MGFGSSDGVRQKFTSKERDNETGLDYFLAFCCRRTIVNLPLETTAPSSYDCFYAARRRNSKEVKERKQPFSAGLRTEYVQMSCSLLRALLDPQFCKASRALPCELRSHYDGDFIFAFMSLGSV